MRLIALVCGSTLLLLGLVLTATPIPGTSVLIAAGIGLLISYSKKAEQFVRRNRTRFSRFNQGLTWLENHMGERLSAPLRHTRPTS